MSEIPLIQLILVILLFVVAVSVLTMANSFLVGWLVFRSKREQHESLIMRQEKNKKPIIIDDLAEDEDIDGGEEVAKSLEAIMNGRAGRFAEVFAGNQMKERRGGADE